jgi:hypothetical protein
MRIQYASDLHLEFYDERKCDEDFYKRIVTPVEDAAVLILAGDIGYPESNLTREFVKWCCANWRHVVWVFGNHEYYTSYISRFTMSEKERIALEYTKDPQMVNLHLLYNQSIEVDSCPGLRIVGTTLWTDIPSYHKSLIRKSMNDFRNILVTYTTHFQVEHWNSFYQENVAFLKRQLDQAEKDSTRVLVVTHHLPSFKCIQEHYKGSDMNCGFATNAEDLIEHGATAAWICGHSHGQKDTVFQKLSGETVHVVYNARGYPKEESVYTYNPSAVLEV